MQQVLHRCKKVLNATLDGVEAQEDAWMQQGKPNWPGVGCRISDLVCTREWCNRLGRTPIYRDFRVNHIFHNTFPMREH